jgi:hypothetical protein
MKTVKAHEKLLHLLQQKEATGKLVAEEEILNYVGWKQITFRTYLNKGQLADFLSQTDDSPIYPVALSKQAQKRFRAQL